MKLSEIKGEQALDVLADLIDPLAKMASDKELVSLLRSNKPKVFAVKQALKNHKKEVIEVLAILDGQRPEDYKPNIIEIPMKLLELLNDEELIVLFHSQEPTRTSFGSATVNTEVEER